MDFLFELDSFGKLEGKKPKIPHVLASRESYKQVSKTPYLHCRRWILYSCYHYLKICYYIVFWNQFHESITLLTKRQMLSFEDKKADKQKIQII